MTHGTALVPGEIVSVGPRVRRIVAPNPGMMTGPGTNTYLVGGDDGVVVIDPGPDEASHLDAIAAAGAGRIRAIACTHTHPDHAPGAAGLRERTGAGVLGFTSRDALTVDREVGDGDRIEAGPTSLAAVHTPGHASNHLCFWLEAERLLFSGDHVMSGSTVVISPPDGDMVAYLDSLARVRAMAPDAIAPGHGQVITDVDAYLASYIDHRLAREAEVAATLARIGPAGTEALVAEIYTHVAADLHPVAQRSVWAHLRKLAAEGRVTTVGSAGVDDADAVWTRPEAMTAPYVHGYRARENERLQDQAGTLVDLLHSDTVYTAGSAVLEAGCGVGSQTVTLAGRSPGARFTSVDISAESIAEAGRRVEKAGLTNVDFRRGDIFALPFEPESFDHVFVCFVLEHLARPVEALRGLIDLLRPGGTVTVIEGDHGSAYFHPDSTAAHAAIACQITLQERAGGDARVGRRVYPLMVDVGLDEVRVSPRMVYVDASRPDLVDGFTRKTFTAMIEGVREPAIASGLADAATFDAGIRALERTTEPDGTFCYTFFKGVGFKGVGFKGVGFKGVGFKGVGLKRGMASVTPSAGSAGPHYGS